MKGDVERLIDSEGSYDADIFLNSGFDTTNFITDNEKGTILRTDIVYYLHNISD